VGGGHVLWLWGVIAAVALGVEMLTGTLYFALVSVGALAGLGVGVVGAPPLVQALTMGGVTVAGILVVRPVAVRHFNRLPLPMRTGVDALPGSEALALTGITTESGQIRLKGEVWSARLDSDVTSEPVDQNTRVSVSRIDGATALVFPID